MGHNDRRIHDECHQHDDAASATDSCPNRAECGAPRDTKCRNGEWKHCRVRQANGWHNTPAPVPEDDVPEWQKLGYFDRNDGWG
jgi:hypothetical protein